MHDIGKFKIPDEILLKPGKLTKEEFEVIKKHTVYGRVRAAYGNLASVVGMVCNILLCLGKFVVGTLFGSIAILSLIHISCMGSSSSVQ